MRSLQSLNNNDKNVEIKYPPWEICTEIDQIQLQRFQELEQIDLKLCGNNRTDVKMIINQLKCIQHLHKLQSLKLEFGYDNKCNGNIFKEMFQNISQFQNLQNLSLLFDTDVILLNEFSQSDVDSILKSVKQFPLVQSMELTINRNKITCKQMEICSYIVRRSINLQRLKIEIKDNFIGNQGFLSLYYGLLNLEMLQELSLSLINNQLPVDFSQNLWEIVQQLKELSQFNVKLEDCRINEFQLAENSFKTNLDQTKLKILALDLQRVKNNNQENLISQILTNLSNFPQLINLTIDLGEKMLIGSNGLIILSEYVCKMQNLLYFQLNIGQNNQIKQSSMDFFLSKIQQFHLEDKLELVQEEDYDLVQFNKGNFKLKFKKGKENSCEISKGVELGIKHFQKLKQIIIKIQDNNQYVISNLRNNNIKILELNFASTNYNFDQLAGMFDTFDSNQLNSLHIEVHYSKSVQPEFIKKFYENINKQKSLQNLRYKIESQIKHRDEIITHLSDQIINNYQSIIDAKFKIDDLDDNDQVMGSLNSLFESLQKIQILRFLVNTSDTCITLNCEAEQRCVNLTIFYSEKDSQKLIESILYGFFCLINLKNVEFTIHNTKFQIIAKDYVAKTSLENVNLYEMIDFQEMINTMSEFKENSFIVSKINQQQNIILNLMKLFKKQKALQYNSNSINCCLQQYLDPSQLNMNYLKQLKLNGYIQSESILNIIPYFSSLEELNISLQQKYDFFDSTFFVILQLQQLKTLILRILPPKNLFSGDYILEMSRSVRHLNKTDYTGNKLNYFNLKIEGNDITSYPYYTRQKIDFQIILQRIKSLLPRLVYFK